MTEMVVFGQILIRFNWPSIFIAIQKGTWKYVTRHLCRETSLKIGDMNVALLTLHELFGQHLRGRLFCYVTVFMFLSTEVSQSSCTKRIAYCYLTLKGIVMASRSVN